MTTDFETRCYELLEALGLARREDIVEVSPLTGGVASDIARVLTADKTYCVKFALAKLRVAAEWLAPVHRNAAEYAWLKFAGKASPGSAPNLLGRSEALNGFVMEFVEGDSIRLWKTDLLENGPRSGDAKQVGQGLVQIHAASSKPDFDRRSFENQDDFYDLRLEPYLVSLKSKHTALTTQIEALIESYQGHENVLVHGDISPKNIMLRQSQPVFLDAECATMGDACFDIAFCLNHLVLKSIHLPGHTQAMLKAAREFWKNYSSGVTWEPVAELERRVAYLLPALMLARVDGKSPVEYLSPSAQSTVRKASIELIENPVDTLADLLSKVEDCPK